MARVDAGLRPLFRANVSNCHWTSVETGGTARGVPDSNYCMEGREGWIEYKATRAWSVVLRPEQIGWHVTRWRHGGRSLIAVRRFHDGGPRLGDAVDELHLYRGDVARELHLHGLRGRETRAAQGEALRRSFLGEWHGGPGRWDWTAVRRHMLIG